MPTNSPLQDFIAQVGQRDLARQSRYKINIGLPAGLNLTSGSDIERTINLFCDEAQLPGIEFATKSFHVYGPGFERPQAVSYNGEVRLSFIVDQDFLIRQVFEKWMHSIIKPMSYTFEYPDVFMTSGIVITQLKYTGEDLTDGNDVGVYSVRLLEAFPKSIAAMSLGYGSNAIHRLNVTFAFRNWIPFYGDGDPPFDFTDDTDQSDPNNSPTIPTAPTETMPWAGPGGPT